MEQPVFRPATDADWPAVAALLSEAHLPLAGARDHLARFILAWQGDDLAGCVGLERYGRTGLLRSVAVRPAQRGTGLGQALTRRALLEARRLGLGQVVLLTETAQGFFPKFGFVEINRPEAPPEVRESVEFTSACPDSAVVMAVTL